MNTSFFFPLPLIDLLFPLVVELNLSCRNRFIHPECDPCIPSLFLSSLSLIQVEAQWTVWYSALSCWFMSFECISSWATGIGVGSNSVPSKERIASHQDIWMIKRWHVFAYFLECMPRPNLSACLTNKSETRNPPWKTTNSLPPL